MTDNLVILAACKDCLESGQAEVVAIPYSKLDPRTPIGVWCPIHHNTVGAMVSGSHR